MNFNPENMTNPNSAEFKLLKSREDKILQLNKILADMENERNLLYSDIKRGAEPNSFVLNEFLKLKDEEIY